MNSKISLWGAEAPVRTGVRSLAVAVMLLLTATAVADEYDVTFKSLLEEMADPAAHSKWSVPSYTCRQSSSYSRESVTPATAAEDGKFHPETGRDWGKGWFKNDDFAHFVREEVVDGKTEFVLHESAGPGCITRFWTAFMLESDNEGGAIKIYLDGSDTPVIDMSAKRLLGSNGLVAYPFSFYAPAKTENDTWHGNNLYLPIPYANGCKISYRPYPDGVDAYTTGLYYQINYRTYAAGTKVESFSQNNIVKYEREIYNCGVKLLGPKGLDDHAVKSKPKSVLHPGKTASMKLSGEKCITSLTLQLKADDIAEALGKTLLAISFDGEQTVLCPVGSFYGIGTRQLANNTFYVHAAPNGVMTAYWTMPFGKEAKVSVINQSSEDVTLERFKLTAVDSKWDAERSMYFHASWCETKNIDASDRSDYNYVRIKGKGKYVADGLAVYNHHPNFQGDSWWGEGDEKIFVDGEAFPSHFGTGTEDYYSYAYCRPQAFAHPPISQPSGEGNKRPGLSQNNRYRLLDDIPFEQSLDFYMEIWHAYNTPVDYSPATFWYAFKGCSWSHENNY